MVVSVKMWILFFFFVHCLQAQEEQTGQCDCKPVSDCEAFQEMLDEKDFNQLKKQKLCGFDGKVPMYCCPKIKGEDYFNELNRICGVYLQSAVVGGIYAKPHEYPWMAAFVHQDKVVCEGVLVSEDLIVTSAYCFSGTSLELEKVKLGNANVTKAKEFEIKSVSVHPDAENNNNFANNLAVIKLKEKLTFDSTILPICLPEATDLQNENLEAVGWPRPWSNIHKENDETLVSINTKPVDQDTCQAAYQSSKVQLESSHICAQEAYKRGHSCLGDLGGPLVSLKNHRYSLIGIGSFGPQACYQLPEVYTSILSHKDWILQKMGKFSPK